jgi:hypothetical protein
VKEMKEKTLGQCALRCNFLPFALLHIRIRFVKGNCHALSYK